MRPYPVFYLTPKVKFTFDPAGWMLLREDPKGETVTFTQTMAGTIATWDDVKGNQTSRPATLSSPALNLEWNFDNQLIGADTNGSAGSLEVTFEYDALGRRVSRSHSSGNVVYVHAGQQVIADYARGTAASTPTYGYVYADYVDEPILRHAGTGSTLPGSGDNALFYHRNQQYSIIGLTNAAGTLVERYTYTAYGTLGIYAANGTVRTSSTYANRYTYTGREYDPDLKLFHFRARWYDPATGGFISRDPLGYVDGMSLYRGYFGVEDVDPSGLILRTQGKPEPKSSRVMDGLLKAIDHCNSVRARKTQQDNEPDPPPNCETCESNCQAQVAEAKRHQRVRALLSQFGLATCVAPPVLCVTCKKGWGGFYDPGDRKVRLCWNAYCNDDMIERLVTVLAHELTHALQDCAKPLSGRNCKYDLQAELEAYYCGKQCDNFDSCLQAAIGSACAQLCYAKDLGQLYGELKAWFELRTTFGQFCHFPRAQFP